MAWPKGKPRPPNAGRKKGTRNRVTTEMQDLTLKALDELGGIEYLVALGRDEPAVFGSLLRKVMPQVVEGEINTNSKLEVIDLSDKGKQ